MADVFLSYKREDRAAAKDIADAVEKHGFSVFFDAEIGVGEAWNSRISREIEQAKCVAVLWSSRSADIAVGEWVHNEAREGKGRSILAPALIGDCEVPLEFSGVQAADLRAWRGDPSEPEWLRFIGRVGDCVKRAPQQVRAQPWRRRWVRIAAGIVAGAAVAAGVTYFVVAKPWAPPPASADNPAPQPPALVTPVSVPNADLPGAVERVLQISISAGDCDGLKQDIDGFREEVPQIARYERAYMHACQAHATQLASATPPSNPAAAAPPTHAATTPASPGHSTQGQAGQTQTRAQAQGASFLAGLRTRDTGSLTRADTDSAAREIGVESAALAAVVQVEGARGSAFTEDGRPKILFEPHIFSRLTQRRFDGDHPIVSYPNWGGRPYPATQEGRWAQLEEAYGLDPAAALSAASWGRFQVLGQNYRTLGYPSVQAFVSDLSTSEAGQLRALIAFLRANRLVEPLQRKDWDAFARAYNGPAGVERYGAQLRAAYAQAASQ